MIDKIIAAGIIFQNLVIGKRKKTFDKIGGLVVWKRRAIHSVFHRDFLEFKIRYAVKYESFPILCRKNLL